MTRYLRHAALVALLAASSLDALSASRPPLGELNDEPFVAISSVLGRPWNIDPLVDPNPFFLVSPWQVTVPMTTTVVQRGGERSLDLPLDIQAMNFSGTIFLDASCMGCTGIPFDYTVIPNQITVGSTVPAAPDGAISRFSESGLSPGGDGASIRIPAAAVLRVTTATPLAGPTLAVVRACKSNDCLSPGSLLGTGYFMVSQVVIPGDQPTGDCPNVVSPSWRRGDENPPGYQRPDLLPLQQFTRDLFLRKRTSPERRSFAGGVYAPVNRVGWDILVEKPPVPTSGSPISPTESVVRLVNNSRNLRSLVAVGSSCQIRGNIVLNPGDPPQELRISRGNTTTIVLTGDSRALGRFSDNNFWTLFGGRKVTLSAIN